MVRKCYAYSDMAVALHLRRWGIPCLGTAPMRETRGRFGQGGKRGGENNEIS